MGDNRIFGADGYSQYGYDREGYNREGYNCSGKNRFGLTKKQTEEALLLYSKIRQYNMSPIQMMRAYLDGPLVGLSRFARDHGIDEGDLKKFRTLASKDDPELEAKVAEKSDRARKQIVAILRGDAEKVISGNLEIERFWADHQRVGAKDLRIMLRNDRLFHLLIQKFLWHVCEEHPEYLVGSEHQAKVLRVFASCGSTREQALIELRNYYSPNLSREVKARVQKVERYLKSFEEKDLAKLLGQRTSFDGGKSWLVFDDTLIAETKKVLAESGTWICVRTVFEEAKKQFLTTVTTEEAS